MRKRIPRLDRGNEILHMRLHGRPGSLRLAAAHRPFPRKRPRPGRRRCRRSTRTTHRLLHFFHFFPRLWRPFCGRFYGAFRIWRTWRTWRRTFAGALRRALGGACGWFSIPEYFFCRHTINGSLQISSVRLRWLNPDRGHGAAGHPKYNPLRPCSPRKAFEKSHAKIPAPTPIHPARLPAQFSPVTPPDSGLLLASDLSTR